MKQHPRAGDQCRVHGDEQSVHVENRQRVQQMLRVGKHAIVAFPNFGHWSARLSHLWSGKAPRTKLFPYDWYDSPNIHFLTVDDFEGLIQQEHWTVERRICLAGESQIQLLPNLFAEVAVYQICK